MEILSRRSRKQQGSNTEKKDNQKMKTLHLADTIWIKMVKIWEKEEILKVKTKDPSQNNIDRKTMSKIKAQQKMLNTDPKELQRNRMKKKSRKTKEDKKEKKTLFKLINKILNTLVQWNSRKQRNSKTNGKSIGSETGEGTECPKPMWR